VESHHGLLLSRLFRGRIVTSTEIIGERTPSAAAIKRSNHSGAGRPRCIKVIVASSIFLNRKTAKEESQMVRKNQQKKLVAKVRPKKKKRAMPADIPDVVAETFRGELPMVEKPSDELTNEVKEAANTTASDEKLLGEYDLEALRLDQNFDEIVGARPVLATVGVRKPGPQEWFRVHPDPSWRLQTTLLLLKEDRESYLVSPDLRVQLWDEILPIVLYTAVSRQGEPFLWPVRLPKADGKTDRFMETDLTAAKVAETHWTRRYWVADIKSHKILTAENLTDEPVWPGVDFKELVKIAFKDRFINDLSHPVIKKLRGVK
jgi:hypothetical protein